MGVEKYVFFVVASCYLCSGFAAAEIRNVTAKQRFPWNGKVDITYEVIGDISDGLPEWNYPVLVVSATNRVAGTSYTATAATLSGDTGTEEGVHHVIWDLHAQGLFFKSEDVVFTVAYSEKPNPAYVYCVIDLSAGSSAETYPVIYLTEPPDGGFNVSEYKTTKLVMKRIEPGSFKMGGTYDVTLTKPFYCGIFEVTQKQYSLVTGSNPSRFTADMRPVERVYYGGIRGSTNGANWPYSSAVDTSSFMGKLRSRTGLNFDLPTEAQWEYACCEGSTAVNSVNENYMWYGSNSGSGTHDVGTKLPNSWGLYDMHGNVWEWCLDWYGSLTSGVIDPTGSSSGPGRVFRGGSWGNSSSYCSSSYRGYDSPSIEYRTNSFGFRIVRTLSE